MDHVDRTPAERLLVALFTDLQTPHPLEHKFIISQHLNFNHSENDFKQLAMLWTGRCSHANTHKDTHNDVKMLM